VRGPDGVSWARGAWGGVRVEGRGRRGGDRGCEDGGSVLGLRGDGGRVGGDGVWDCGVVVLFSPRVLDWWS
jgi:hypothetical protein